MIAFKPGDVVVVKAPKGVRMPMMTVREVAGGLQPGYESVKCDYFEGATLKSAVYIGDYLRRATDEELATR